MENQRTTQCFMDAYWATNLQVIQDYLGENVWFVMVKIMMQYTYMIYTILLNFFDFICIFLHDKVKRWIK